MKKLSYVVVAMFVAVVCFSFQGCKCGADKEKDECQAKMIESITQQMTEGLALTEAQVAQVKVLNETYLPKMMLPKCTKGTCNKPCEKKCAGDSAQCKKPCEKKCEGDSAQCKKACEKRCEGDSAQCKKACEKKCAGDSAQCKKACEKKCAGDSAQCKKACDGKKECTLSKEEIEKKIAEANAAKVEYIAKLKEILTPEQFAKFESCQQCNSKPCKKACEGDSAQCKKACEHKAAQ